MIDIIEDYCMHAGIKSIKLTGQSKNRGALIQEFQTNNKVQVFICSLLAGGIGIDLTAASTVVHYDRWWNPSKENQATDRTHRIGQTQCVQVFKLVTKNTIEERIDSLISKKSDIFHRFIEKDSPSLKWLSKEDILELLQPKNG